MRISLIANAPDPGTVESMRAPIAALREAGHEVHPQLTFEPGDARRMARQAAAAGADLVVAAGGDGTINEVINGLADARPGGNGADPPRLALLPLGTANDLATALGIPGDPAEALRLAVEGAELRCDVAIVGDRHFLNVSTGGIGAEATEEAPQELKRMLGRLAYFVTGVEKLVALDTAHARFVAEEAVYEGPFLLYAVGNSRLTGGGNLLTPRARLGDGLLDVCVVPAMPRMDFLRLLPELRAGRHVDHPDVVYRQVRELVVEPSERISVNVDGEPIEGERFHYRMAPFTVRVMVPRDTDA